MSNYVQVLKQEKKDLEARIECASQSCEDHIVKMRKYLMDGEYTVDLETAIEYVEKIKGELI